MVNTHKKSDSTRTKYIKVYLLKIQENHLWMNYGKEYNLFLTVSSVQLLNCVWLFVTQRTAASQASCPSPTPRANSNSCLCDAIQPSHPQLSPSPPALNLLQHQDLFKWVSFFASGGQSIGVSASASVLPMSIQDWCSLWLTGWISLQLKGLSRVFSIITVQKHQFFGAQLSV